MVPLILSPRERGSGGEGTDPPLSADTAGRRDLASPSTTGIAISAILKAYSLVKKYQQVRRKRMSSKRKGDPRKNNTSYGKGT